MTDVLVVAPVRVHRESLSTALDNEESLSVVGTAATMAEALPRLEERGASDVVVIDAVEPEDVDLSPPATPARPELRLIAVGVRDDEALEWIEAGVAGCVPPDASLDDLAAAVTSVARGEIATSPAATTHLLRRIRSLAPDTVEVAEEARLTPRQKQVLGLVADELSNKQIARRLSIQEQTVKNHVHGILLRLGAHSRGEAAARVTRRVSRSPDR